MGFAEAWTKAIGSPSQIHTPKDKLDRMDIIQPRGNSVHTVHIVPKVSSQAHETGLSWLPSPPNEAALSFDGWWAAFDLADVCRLYAVRVVRAGERVLAVYPPALEHELIAYVGSLLAEARVYLSPHMDKLPVLAPAEAVEIVKSIMRQHPGLRFSRGEGGSMWPLYPRAWTAGQRVTLQSLWFVAGPALDREAFMEVEA